MTRTLELPAWVAPLLIRLRGSKKLFSSAGATRARIAELQQHPTPHAPPEKLGEVDVALREIAGWPVYTVTPRGADEQRRALYLHGGAYLNEITGFHWRLIAEIAETARATVVVPIYPLVPRGTAAEVVPVVADLAAELVGEVGASRVTLLGDSAGGAIALSAAMLLRDRGIPSPTEIVLLATPIDLRFTNPLIARLDRFDPWLAVPGVEAAVEMWRGDLPLEDVRVSPFFGSLSGLGRITSFSGTRDIAYADAVTLRKKARDEAHPFDLVRAPGMLHVYPLLPIREGAIARRRIAAIVGRRA